MNMDLYLHRVVMQGKLICDVCKKLASVLIKIEDMYVCDLCEKEFEENDGT